MATCAECGNVFTPKVRSAEFCSTPCRKAFNNRRAMRGAQIYDLAMIWRTDRAGEGKDALFYLCRAIQAFAQEDAAAGRKRHSTLRELKDRGALTALAATVVANGVGKGKPRR